MGGNSIFETSVIDFAFLTKAESSSGDCIRSSPFLGDKFFNKNVMILILFL